jgi:putative endonuclease
LRPATFVIPTKEGSHVGWPVLMRKQHQYWVYILSSKTGVLYIGITNDLQRRVYEHKHKCIPGFTAKYNVTRLVHFEEYRYVDQAIAREKELKAWRREKKVALIEDENPSLKDLAADWFKD